MKTFVTFLILAIICIAIIVISIKLISNSIKLSNIVRRFKKNNVIVFGKKGTGKDLIFNYVIRKRRKDKYNHYYANLSYGYNYHPIKAINISVYPNTFENFIADKIKRVKTERLYEKEDIYLSDIGVYFPSQYDGILHKTFPSLPIYYALSRHIASSNIHCNTQNLDRCWKALREQADYFIKTKKTVRFFNLLITFGTTYEEYKSASASLLPMKRKLLENKVAKGLRLQYEATNGIIENFFVIQKIKHIKYDTRAFEKILFGPEAQSERPDRVLENKELKRLAKVIKKCI